MKRILVATDGSDGSNRAVDYAAASAKEQGADLLIVNVIGGYGLPNRVLKSFTRSQHVWLEEMLESQSAATLKGAAARARKAGATTIELESRTGEVALTIIEIAQQKAADAIVVGKRGADRISTMLLGSVSQKLVSLAPLPVTVVP